MTACDVAAIAKPWEQQHELARKVADEFFDQGDMEKLRLKEAPIVSELNGIKWPRCEFLGSRWKDLIQFKIAAPNLRDYLRGLEDPAVCT